MTQNNPAPGISGKPAIFDFMPHASGGGCIHAIGSPKITSAPAAAPPALSRPNIPSSTAGQSARPPISISSSAGSPAGRSLTGLSLQDPSFGVFVLDIDGAEGERSLAQLEHQHGAFPEIYCQQWTGGGRSGWQAFFAWPTGRTIGNSAGGLLGPKLDVRGSRGYVLIPPSSTAEAYHWAVDREPGHSRLSRRPTG